MAVSDARIEILVKALYAAKMKLTATQDDYTKIEAELLAVLDDSVKELLTSTDTANITATIVRGTRIVIDEDRLKKQLGAATWKRVTTPVLDKAKLEACIALGDVDATTVAMCSDEKANKPYFKFKETRKKVTKYRQPSAAARKIRRS